MFRVIREFRDKYNLQKVYKAGDEFFSNEQKRIKNLLERGLIERVEEPSLNSLNSLTKKEIMQLLDEKGIEYNAKAKKEELIELLQGGG